MQVKINVEVDDIIEELIVAELTDYYNSVLTIEPDNDELLDALTLVIKKYMTEAEFDAWINES